jgi:DNA-binding beta-propeller fold protein YncE
MPFRKLPTVICLTVIALLGQLIPAAAADAPQIGRKRFLYVATPGIRDDLTFGGHGVLVFDIDHGHKFVRRIAFEGFSAKGQPLNVKGIAANAQTARLYVTTLEHLIAIDLMSDRVLWQKSYEGGCDRLALSPDGRTIYLPSLEKGHWHVVDALDGRVLAKITPNSGAHNTIYGPDGTRVYLAGLKSPVLNIAETEHHAIEKTVGPFSNVIRPFTINGSQTLCFVNVNDRLGFEIGDLRTGKVLHQVDVQDFKKGPVKMHGCPCHGIGLTPDERELWLCDSFNRCIHIFDATVMPPRQITSIRLRDEPGWITFGIEGTLAYPATGEVIDTQTRKIIATLQDENSRAVHSEKLLEIDFDGTRLLRAGNQFGIGKKMSRE